MKTSMVVGGVALGLALSAGPAPAQMVQAGVVIRSGPVTGHVVVGERAPVVVYRPARRVVIVERVAPRVIVVERARYPRARGYPWWARRGYRHVVVYTDGRRYYDQRFDGRPGIREIAVFERDGHYYRDWDD